MPSGMAMQVTWFLLCGVFCLHSCTCDTISQSAARSVAAIVGDVTARQAACTGYTLPAEYLQYQDTSFLGPYQSIQVGAVNFSYHQFGPLQRVFRADNPLVLIVGSAATSQVWTPDLLKNLAQTRQVITFDNRGIGSEDDEPTENLSVESYGESTINFIEALDLEYANILGWSLGGFIAGYLAENYGDILNKFVFVSTSAQGRGYYPGAYYAEAQKAFQSGQDIPTPALFPDTNLGNKALCRKNIFYPLTPGKTITSQQILAQGNALAKGKITNPATADAVQNITNPVLILHGSQDVSLDIANAYFLLENIPEAQLLAYQDAGHGLILQYGLELAQKINTFLNA